MSKVFEHIDWKLFRAQKSRLIELANDDNLATVDVELLDGLINFLDHFMDCAAEELNGGSPLVFGDLE